MWTAGGTSRFERNAFVMSERFREGVRGKVSQSSCEQPNGYSGSGRRDDNSIAIMVAGGIFALA